MKSRPLFLGLALVSVLSPLPAASWAEDPPTFVLQWGSFGFGDGQFDGMGGLGIDRAGNIYVPDLRGDRIQKFDANGNFVGRFGSSGSDTGQFSLPHDVAIASDGTIYVNDFNNSRIQVFDPQFRFLRQWPSGFAGGAMAIALSPADDALYIAYYDGMMVKCATTGLFERSWQYAGAHASLYDFAVGPSGAVYICDELAGVEKFGPNGDLLASWNTAQPGQLLFLPRPVGVDADENVYVGNGTSSARIVKYTSTGQYLSHWGDSGANPGQFYSMPSSIVASGTRDIYALDRGGSKVLKFSYIPTSVRKTSWGQLKRKFR